MAERYDFQAIEKKWQEYWAENDIFHTEEDSSKEKYYVLEMFPYPSGNFTWAMYGIIPSAMSPPDICG